MCFVSSEAFHEFFNIYATLNNLLLAVDIFDLNPATEEIQRNRLSWLEDSSPLLFDLFKNLVFKKLMSTRMKFTMLYLLHNMSSLINSNKLP